MRSFRARCTALLTVGAFALVSCSSPTESDRLSQITLSVSTLTLDAIGATEQVTAIARDQDFSPMEGVTINWASSATSVATVSPTGLVTAVGNGAATITASSGDVSINLGVTVAQAVAGAQVVSGGDQSGAILTPLAQPVVVRVGDRLGNPMGGRQVTFAVTSGGGSITTTTATPGADGLASTTWTLGSITAQLQRLSVTVEGVTTITTVAANALAGPATSMVVASTSPLNGQAAVVNTALERRPSVIVRDALGNGVANATVNFTVTGGAGSVTGGAAITNSLGVATVGSWILGAAAGTNTLRASFAGLPAIDFSARGVADVCVKDGANLMELDVTYTGALTTTDCRAAAPDSVRFDFYRLDLAAPTSVIIEMSAPVVDAWLSLYDYDTMTLIAENDDIVLGIDTDSRIPISLQAGSYIIRARSFGPGQYGAYTLEAREAAVGVPTRLEVVAGQGQRSAPGAAAILPSVRVVDESGTGVAGITVNFATVPGVGAVTGASAVTDANGLASPGSWTLAAGANVLSATVPGASIAGNPAVISATGKAGAATAGFDISLRFVNMPTANQLATFNTAATRWENIITSDLPSQNTIVNVGQCNSPVAINELIDDLAIIVRLEPIDGAGSVLGSAGPCALRASGNLTVVGTMRFDTADLANLEAGGNFGNVILHEMGHVLGIGTLWNIRGLLINSSPVGGPPNDTHFNGAAAIAAFNTIGGTTYTGGQRVPVENTNGAGTINSHWRESIMFNELMTGFLNAGANPLSLVTVASLADLGYTVNSSLADAFTISPTLRAPGAVAGATIQLKNDIWDGERFVLDARGRPLGKTGPMLDKKARPRR